MKAQHLAIGMAIASCAVAAALAAGTNIGNGDASPIYGVTIPQGYR